jgi:hypothetical protein
VLVEDRAFRGGGGVSVRNRESLCMGLGGGHTVYLLGLSSAST